MADEIVQENATVTTGRELLDATQNAVINAVENVSEIIETKEEKKVETVVEQIAEPKEPFYLETEFWVAMAFCIFVCGLFIPVLKVVKVLLRKKIDGIIKRIDDAVNLRDEAQKLLADYERKLLSAQTEAENITKTALAKIEAEKENKLQKLGEELRIQTAMVENKIHISANNLKKEISELICNIAIDNVKKICKNKITSEKQDDMIESSIDLIRKLSEK